MTGERDSVLLLWRRLASVRTPLKTMNTARACYVVVSIIQGRLNLLTQNVTTNRQGCARYIAVETQSAKQLA
jgi:hypothetical protein